jgi:crotonobetainyl-CoA:carnitine CoA-transferase CaiB-like acyl-CoA transferase
LEYVGAPWRMANGYRLRWPAPLLDQDGPSIRAAISAVPDSARHPVSWPQAARGERLVAADLHLPLAGVRIVDLTVVWSGPGGTALLGDLGAEVIRMEANNRVGRQDSAKWTRESLADAGYRIAAFPDQEPQPRPYDRSAMFNWHARNKLSACANLETPEGREAILRLVEVSDVLIENNSVNTVDKLGLGTDVLLARNPRLIVARMPPMGLTGPMSRYLGYGPNFNALVGVAALEGYEGEPLDTSGDNYHMDEASPWGVAFAVMLALWDRERTGQGGMVEFAQAENVMAEVGEYLLDDQLNDEVRPAMGNTDPVLLQDVFACVGADTWVAVSVRDDADWQHLCAVIGDPELAEQGHSRELRIEHSRALRERIGRWVASRAADQVVELLRAAELPVGAVMSETAVLDDPQLAARDWFQTRTHPAVGTYRYPGLGWRARGFDTVYGRPFPSFGEDNEYVYREVLGYSADQLADLRRRTLVTDEQYA